MNLIKPRFTRQSRLERWAGKSSLAFFAEGTPVKAELVAGLSACGCTKLDSVVGIELADFMVPEGTGTLATGLSGDARKQGTCQPVGMQNSGRLKACQGEGPTQGRSASNFACEVAGPRIISNSEFISLGQEPGRFNSSGMRSKATGFKILAVTET